MNTEYNDNYWMSNRRGTVHNILENDRLSYGVSLDGYEPFQVGRQTDHSHDFVSTRNDTTNTNENSPVDPRRSFARATQPYGPYSYQSARVHPMDRYCRVHWENFGPMRVDNARGVVVDNVGRKSQPSEQPNRNGPGVARIRVRSLNSLNCSPGGLVPQQKQFDGRLNYDYNGDQRQQNPAQKNNVPNYPPSFGVNSFRSLLQNTARPPEPPVTQERFANAYQNNRARFFPRHQVNDIRQTDAFYGRSHSLLHLLCKDGEMQPAEPARFLRHVRVVHSKSKVPPNVTVLNPSHTLEDSLRQPSHKNPPSHLECSLRVEVPRGSQGSNLVQPALPPVLNNTSKPIEPPRATAVISNSPISNQLPELFTSTSIPENSKPEIANNDPSAVPDVAGGDTLKVKKEPSDFLCDSALDIEIHTVKSENIQVEDIPEDSDVSNSNNNVNDNVITDVADNGGERQNIDKPNIDPVDVSPIPKVEMPNTPEKVSSSEEPPAAKPNYKSEINRDKLHMLIEFLKGDDDKHADFMRKIPLEKIKRQKEVDSSTKPKSKKPPAAKGDMSISKKMPKVEVVKGSSQPFQRVKDVDSVKRPPHKSKDEQNPAFEKESGKSASPNKAKPQRDVKEHKRPKEKSEVKDRKPEKGAKPDTVTKKSSAEHGEKRGSKTDADVTRSETCIKVEKQVKQENVGSSWTLGRNRHEETEHGQRTKSTEQQKCAKVPEGSDGPKPNLKYHFCEHCNLVSPIEYFWANAVSGEMKCLNCFKLMHVNSTEEIFKLTRNGKVQETTTNMSYGAALNPKSAISNESENPVELNKPSSRSPNDSKGQSGQRGKRKHAAHERRVKRRKPEEKCEKKTSESQTKKSRMQSGSECSKSKQWKSSSDGSSRREERSGKNSSVDATEGHANSEATKKRGNSKEEPKLQSEGERHYDYIQKYMEKSVRLYEKMKKSKEMNDHKAEWEMKGKSMAEDKKESDETKALKKHRRHRKKQKKEMERKGKEDGNGRRRRDENEVGSAEHKDAHKCHQRRLSSLIEDLALKKICREVEIIKRCVSFHGEESSKSAELFAQLEKTTQKALNLVRSV